MKITRLKSNGSKSFSELQRGACFRIESEGWFGIKTRDNEYLYFWEMNATPVFVSNLSAPRDWQVMPCHIEEVILI